MPIAPPSREQLDRVRRLDPLAFAALLEGGVSLRRGGICAAVGVAMTLGLLAANGVSASPVATRPGAALAPQVAARWRLPHLASGAGINADQRAGGARWRLLYRSPDTAVELFGVTAINLRCRMLTSTSRST